MGHFLNCAGTLADPQWMARALLRAEAI